MPLRLCFRQELFPELENSEPARSLRSWKAQREVYMAVASVIWILPASGHLHCIRMAVKKDGKVYVQAGGGIVADSVPELEYEESANKAAAVMQAIQNAGEVDEL